MSNAIRRCGPTTPGEILREEFLAPIGMTQKLLADHLGCDVKVVNRIVNGRSAVTAEMALKLGAAFRTTPEFWMNAQKAVDLWEAARHVSVLPRPLLKASGRAGPPDRSPSGMAASIRKGMKTPVGKCMDEPGW